jgi:hypothetical protein
MTSPKKIDLALPPYNVVPDWNGSDSTASNWTTAFDDAVAALVASNVGLVDSLAGTVGGTITCSAKGAIMLDAGRVLPMGVSFDGESKYTTTLKLRNASDITKHFITLGDPTIHSASFGSKIKNVKLASEVVFGVPRGVAMVYSNNNQDTRDMCQHLAIFAGGRSAIWYETAYGGATGVDCYDVQAMTHKATNPVFHFSGSDATSFRLDLVLPNGEYDASTGAGIEGSIGLELGAGRFTISRCHPEYLHQGIRFKITSGKAEVSDLVGHPTVPYLTVIENLPGQLGKITMKDVANGSYMTVNNLQPGAVNVSGSIDAERRF